MLALPQPWELFSSLWEHMGGGWQEDTQLASAPQLLLLTAPGLLHCIQLSSWHSNVLYLVVSSLFLQGVRVSEMQTPLISFSSEKIYFPFPQLTTAYLNSLKSSENFEKHTSREFC